MEHKAAVPAPPAAEAALPPGEPTAASPRGVAGSRGAPRRGEAARAAVCPPALTRRGRLGEGGRDGASERSHGRADRDAELAAASAYRSRRKLAGTANRRRCSLLAAL